MAGERPSPQPLHRLPVLSQPMVGSSLTLGLNDVSLPLSRRARDLQSSLLSACHWLGPEDVKLVGEHPIAAGEFADIWEGIHEGHKVVLKSYRCSTSSETTQVAEACYNHGLPRVHY